MKILKNKKLSGVFALALVGALALQLFYRNQTQVQTGATAPVTEPRTPSSIASSDHKVTLPSPPLSATQKNLFALMESQRWSEILDYLAKGGDPHLRDENGKSLLDWAAMYGQIEVMKELLRRGADVNSQDNEGKTPLMSASSQNHLDAVKLLVESGAALEIKNDVGQTALLVAVENSHEDLVSVFAESGAQLDQRFGENQFDAYLLASNNGDTSMMDKLIEVNADFVRSRDRQGRTAAHWTCADGDIKSAAAILRHGGRLDDKDSQGRTAFSYALENGSDACVAFAEEAGLRDYL